MLARPEWSQVAVVAFARIGNQIEDVVRLRPAD
jgi:hypothetical protein